MQTPTTKTALIQTIHALQEKYFAKYPREDVEQELEKLLHLLQHKKYQVAVVANMSAGKTTFINALFGANVLPMSTKATTDCATHIFSRKGEPKHAIVFLDNGVQVKLSENELGELEHYAKKDMDCADSKYHNVSEIHLYYPLKNIQTNMEFEVVFIDTPGHNSTGGTYSEKHKNTTRSVLQNVNLALFLFDFEQLDANLTSDEQGLWNTIRSRKEKDRDFEVFFVLNKIDRAFKDNFGNINSRLNEEEQIAEKRNRWGIGEREAIDKVHKAAEAHGINSPHVFGVSSYYAFLQRNRENGLNRELQKTYRRFVEDYFEELFGEDAFERELIAYLGFEKLEHAMNEYFETQVTATILKNLYNQLQAVVVEEQNRLEQEKEFLQQPHAEQERNLQKALRFLDQAAPKLEKEMAAEIDTIKNESIEEIRGIFNRGMQEFEGKIEDMVVQAMLFIREYADGLSVSTAAQQARASFMESSSRIYAKTNQTIKLSSGRKYSDAEQKLQQFIAGLLNDARRDFFDIQADIKEAYRFLNKDTQKILKKYKGKIEKEINEQLSINLEHVDKLEAPEIDYAAFINDNIDFMSGNVRHEHQSAKCKTEYYEVDVTSTFAKIISLGFYKKTETRTRQVQVQSAQDNIIINPANMARGIRDSIQDTMRERVKEAQAKHRNNISKSCNEHNDIFVKFRQLRQKDIENLEREISNSKAKIDVLQTQQDILQTFQKGDTK